MDKHIPQGYKDSPLGIIPKEWEVKRLGDLGSFKNGLNFSPNDSGISYYFLGVGDFLNRNVIDVRNLGHIHLKDKLDESYLIKDQDLVFVRSNGSKSLVGRSVLIKSNQEEATYSGFCIRFRSDNKCTTTKYIQHLINVGYLKRFLVYEGRGTNITNLNQDILGRLSFPIPPIAEQDRVLHILSIWDTAIEKQSELIEKFKLRKRALMQQLLTGKKRLPGFSREWKRIKAGDIFMSSSVRGKRSEVLLSATQEHGVIPRDQLEGRVTMPTGNLESFKLVEVGDFVISLRSFQGGIEYSEHRGIVSPAYTVLKPVKEIDKSFYRFYFKSTDLIGHLAIAVIGIRDGKQISYEDFCFVKIPYPRIEEQKAISAILIQAEKEIELANEKLICLQSQKRGLMQQLLTGKIRTTNFE